MCRRNLHRFSGHGRCLWHRRHQWDDRCGHDEESRGVPTRGGLRLSLNAAGNLAHDGPLFLQRMGARGRDRPALTASPMRRSPAETLQAIQSVVPSAHGLPEDARIEDVLCGHYDRSGDLAGSEIYVFPDNTYVYVEWADILPLDDSRPGNLELPGWRPVHAHGRQHPRGHQIH